MTARRSRLYSTSAARLITERRVSALGCRATVLDAEHLRRCNAMIPADGDHIALAEAFQHYSLWYVGYTPPFPVGQDREVTGAWWADTDPRLSGALSSFKAALEGGELTVKVFDTERNMSFAITPAEWRDHRPFADFLSSIDAGVVKKSEGDSLAKYNGLAPYVARGEFNTWFAKRKGLAAERGERGPGAPATKREIVKAAMLKRWPGAIPPALTNVAVQAQIAAEPGEEALERPRSRHARFTKRASI